MLDFTLRAYAAVVRALQEAQYHIQPMADAAAEGRLRHGVLRHDVDRRPGRAVAMAELERDLGARATYYFRAVPESWDVAAVERIASLGHEVGYHYEDLTLARGDMDRAVELFEAHLARFREVVPIRTLCMHGSPRTPWDNRQIWDAIDYRDYGLVAEPYFDVDFQRTLYATDTGRAWNDRRVSRRDHVASPHERPFTSTAELAAFIRDGHAPDRVMVSTHPERWTDSWAGWAQEKAVQAVKRPLKAAYIALRDR